ncbi:MAG: 50S ribosomal protein L44e [Nanoarchaeota archaeon]|nr:50S ribosomal protein L44e [Nanoarchaeota archaeon]
MKVPKKQTRYCPYCKKRTEQKVTLMSTGGKRRTLARGSIARGKLRGVNPGMGNKPKGGSKPAASKWKRKTKSTKRNVLIYKCQECKKSKQAKHSKRVSKIMIE